MTKKPPLESLYGICGQLGAYRLFPVFQNTAPEMRETIIAFWQKNRALPDSADGQTRAKQVVILAADHDDQPVGVSTVYKDDFMHTGMKDAPRGSFYFFRTFVQPGDRVHHLSKKITGCTYDHLKTFAEADKPKGVVIVAENPKLTKPVLDRLVGSLGWIHIGVDSRGKLVYRRDF